MNDVPGVEAQIVGSLCNIREFVLIHARGVLRLICERRHHHGKPS
jgi:hypothetical protein